MTALDDIVLERDHIISCLKEEILILKTALAEAGRFAHVRLPHDSRETNSTPEYFQKLFVDCAVEQLKNSRAQEAQTDGNNTQ